MTVAVLPAQARQPAFGTVADAAGKPVAGAEVVLWWTPYGELLGPETDRVTATTDARGRFTAQLLPQRAYSAFALGSAQADGSAWLSPVREGVAAHAEVPLLLTLAVPSRTARLRGAEAWAAEGPLRLAAVPTAANVLRIDLTLIDGGAALPPLPSVGGVVVLDAQGEPLWCQMQSSVSDALQIELPPPYVQRVRVLDERGAPVAGAELLLGLGPITGFVLTSLMPVQAPVWHRVGASGADGTATLRLPVAKYADCAMFTLVARCDGRMTVSGCNNGRWFVDGLAAPLPVDAVLPLHLQPRQRLRLVQGEQRLVAPSISIAGSVEVDLGKQAVGRAAMRIPFGQHGIADAEGRITLWSGGTSADFDVWLDPFALPGATMPTVVHARVARTPGDVTVDVDRLRHLRVQVIDASGGPAIAVPVFVLLHERRLHELPPCFTDAAGRVDLRLGDGGWLVLAWASDGMAMRSVDAKAADGDWRLSLAALPRMQLRVVDAQSRPLADAYASLRWGPGHGGPAMPTPANDEEALLLQLEQVVMQRICIGRCSGADGRLDVPLLPFARIAWEVEIHGGASRVALQIEPTTEPRDVVLK